VRGGEAGRLVSAATKKRKCKFWPAISWLEWGFEASLVDVLLRSELHLVAVCLFKLCCAASRLPLPQLVVTGSASLLHMNKKQKNMRNVCIYFYAGTYKHTHTHGHTHIP